MKHTNLLCVFNSIVQKKNLSFFQNIGLFKMVNELGKVEIQEGKTITWKLEGKKMKENHRSPDFYVPGFSNEFFFSVRNEDAGVALLLLLEYFDGVFKTYDIQVILRYNSKEKKQFTVKKTVFYENKTWVVYNIGNININGLLELTCRFLKVYISTEIQVDTNVKKELHEMECNKGKEKSLSELKDAEDEVDSEGDDTLKMNECQRETVEIGCNTENEKASSELKDENDKVDREGNDTIKTSGEIALITSLKNIFLREEYSDVRIKVGDQNYPAHKLIISSRSPVFDKMLKHDMVEKNQGVIYVPDCDPYIFRVFLFYIYTGKIDNINNENVFNLYHMSDKYAVKELKSECAEFLLRNLTNDKICEVILLATEHHDSSLLMHATNFFLDNAKEIVLTTKWKKFVKENPEEANKLFVKFVNKSSLQ